MRAAIARDRCDLGFNPASYWSQAPRMGVDVYAGGAMSPHDDRTTAARGPDARPPGGGIGGSHVKAAMSAL